MLHYFEVVSRDSNSRVRVGRIRTKHGVIDTPAYVMVGTHGRVRELISDELKKTKTQVVIAGAYHLWQRLGDAGLESYKGLHQEMEWDGPLMTDSGGFQVFSLGVARVERVGKVVSAGKKAREPEESLVRITDEGVYFYDQGLEQYLDADKSIWIQERLGADIIFAFDELTSPLADYNYTKKALERTHRWALRCLKAKKSDQLLFGIVQGGGFRDLRQESARFFASQPFDGFGIGGSFGTSFGDTKDATYEALDWVVPFLPEDKPRHFLGIGSIQDIFEGVARGVDLFDCVIPTREARHGGMWTHRGRIDIKRAEFAKDKRVLEEGCKCPVCGELQVSRCELRDLFKAKDPQAGRLATIHNVYFFNTLMEEIRAAIRAGKFSDFRKVYFGQ